MGSSHEAPGIPDHMADASLAASVWIMMEFGPGRFSKQELAVMAMGIGQIVSVMHTTHPFPLDVRKSDDVCEFADAIWLLFQKHKRMNQIWDEAKGGTVQ